MTASTSWTIREAGRTSHRSCSSHLAAAEDPRSSSETARSPRRPPARRGRSSVSWRHFRDYRGKELVQSKCGHPELAHLEPGFDKCSARRLTRRAQNAVSVGEHVPLQHPCHRRVDRPRHVRVSGLTTCRSAANAKVAFERVPRPRGARARPAASRHAASFNRTRGVGLLQRPVGQYRHNWSTHLPSWSAGATNTQPVFSHSPCSDSNRLEVLAITHPKSWSNQSPNNSPIADWCRRPIPIGVGRNAVGLMETVIRRSCTTSTATSLRPLPLPLPERQRLCQTYQTSHGNFLTSWHSAARPDRGSEEG